MYKKTIKYTDYFGNEREEDFYFNLTKSELSYMELATAEPLSAKIDRLVRSKDEATIMELFRDIILRSYGEKSEDGRRFVKSAELAEAFMQTPAYDELFMTIIQNEDEAAAFINGIIPPDLNETSKDRTTVAPA